MTPTQRTLKELRHQGRVCAIVERFNSHVGPHGIRQDLFGCIDVIALDPQRGIVGVQCFGANGFPEHKRKILEDKNQEAYEWLRCGGKLELWGWRKLKLKRGGKAERWVPRVEEITLDDMGVRLC